MNLLLWNVGLAVVWAALWGDFSERNLVVGFVLGYLVLFFSQPVIGSSRYFGHLPRAVGLVFYFLWELILASLRVAYEVLTPTHHMRSGIIALPLDAETDAEITLLANLISLTPGTLSLDVSDDRRTLYVHAMYIDDEDVEGLKRSIKEGFERRVLEVMR
jgi:multicomponent Na+:H+ antiporter subunit E